MMLELLWFMIIVADVLRNYYIIEKKKQSPDYLQSFIFRGAGAIVHGIWVDGIYHIFSELPYARSWAHFTELAFQGWVPLLMFQVFSFALLFNTMLNSLRNQDFDYIGKESGWIETVLSKLPGNIRVRSIYFWFLLGGFILSWIWFRTSIS